MGDDLDSRHGLLLKGDYTRFHPVVNLNFNSSYSKQFSYKYK
jgi:hypothetical protein